jgi:hypothetical protein
MPTNSAIGSCTIQDVIPLAMNIPNVTVPEDVGNAAMNVNRTDAGPITNVHVFTTDGTAIAGTDYTSVNFFHNFAPLETLPVNVPIINRAGVQGDRFFTLNAVASTAAAGDCTIQDVIPPGLPPLAVQKYPDVSALIPDPSYNLITDPFSIFTSTLFRVPPAGSGPPAPLGGGDYEWLYQFFGENTGFDPPDPWIENKGVQLTIRRLAGVYWIIGGPATHCYVSRPIASPLHPNGIVTEYELAADILLAGSGISLALLDGAVTGTLSGIPLSFEFHEGGYPPPPATVDIIFNGLGP